MKTKQQLKDEYAASLGYGNWSTAIKCLALFTATEYSTKEIDNFINGFQELCCNEVAKASLDRAADNAEMIYPDGTTSNWYEVYIDDDTDKEHFLRIHKQSITSPDNIVLL